MKLVLTPELKNKYGKWVDPDTGKFIKWAKTPKTTEALERRQSEIRDFLNKGLHENLTSEELHRLLKLYTTVHLGLQQEWYDAMILSGMIDLEFHNS